MLMIKRLLISVVVGVMAMMLLPLQSIHAYTIFGPQSPDDDYLYFGDDATPKTSPNGITLTVNESSISFQSVIASVTLEYAPGSTLIDDRQISQFLILANNRIVDTFDPVWDYELSKWRVNYQLRIAMEDWNIGSIVNLQVVAVSAREPSTVWIDYDNNYVVAWSAIRGPYDLKPLPTVDKEAITVLEAILAKIDQMRVQLSGQLAQIDASVKKIYEVSPATQSKFDAALANLQAKLPTEQIKDDANAIKEIVEDSANRIKNAEQKLKFGEINWMGEFTTSAVDFTPFTEQIKLLRNILRVTLWCEFFYFVILVLRPRLTV